MGKKLDELQISEGTDVFFTGLFASYLGERRNNPIVRFGRVAMVPEDFYLGVDRSPGMISVGAGQGRRNRQKYTLSP